MNEKLWLTTRGYDAMLGAPRVRSDQRRLRYYAVACCREVTGWASRRWAVAALKLAERYAEGAATVSELITRYSTLHQRHFAAGRSGVAGQAEALFALACIRTVTPDQWFGVGFAAADLAGGRKAFGADTVNRLRRLMPHFLRDIFGNPFRPVVFDPRWRSESAVALARTAYDTGNFTLLPILADALEEAGCDHPDVLAHCREPNGVHVRGCWVVDGVLGKQ